MRAAFLKLQLASLTHVVRMLLSLSSQFRLMNCVLQAIEEYNQAMDRRGAWKNQTGNEGWVMTGNALL